MLRLAITITILGIVSVQIVLSSGCRNSQTLCPKRGWQDPDDIVVTLQSEETPLVESKALVLWPPRVVFKDEGPGELVISWAKDYFSKGIVARPGEKVVLGFDLWNASGTNIMVVTGPDPIVSSGMWTQSQDEVMSEVVSNPRATYPPGSETLIRLRESNGKIKCACCTYPFSHELEIPEIDVSTLYVDLEFRVGVWVGADIRWVTLTKRLSIRVAGGSRTSGPPDKGAMHQRIRGSR